MALCSQMFVGLFRSAESPEDMLPVDRLLWPKSPGKGTLGRQCVMRFANLPSKHHRMSRTQLRVLLRFSSVPHDFVLECFGQFHVILIRENDKTLACIQTHSIKCEVKSVFEFDY